MPADPWVSSDFRLTGRVRYRRGWFGRRVLQVEEAYRSVNAYHQDRPLEEWEPRARWRDATRDERSGVNGVWVFVPKAGMEQADA